MLSPAITQELFSEIEKLPEENIGMLQQFVLFLKHRKELALDDSTYLSSIPGMMDSIEEGVNTPLSECVPLEKVWADV
ncbi:MAG: hypothetical protein FWC15_01460 [Fibromonadales bacterium]|nr:hypothetical protein [Fibromonadales bacterium]